MTIGSRVLLARFGVAAVVAPALALAAPGTACDGQLGTIRIALLTAPGSDPLAEAQTIRLTLSDPPTTLETERADDGSFALTLEVVAVGQLGFLSLEARAADDRTVAVGRTAALPIAAIDADIALFVAAPDSLAEAPVRLEPARTAIGGSRLPYGALLAGGQDGAGVAVDALAIYNVYDHALQIGEPLPASRSGITCAGGLSRYAFLFGGADETGAPTADFWRFDTQTAPAGSYLTLLSNDDSLARTGAGAVAIGQDVFLVTGDPAVVLDGLTGRASAETQAPPLAGVTVSLELDALVATALVVGADVGATGAVLYESGTYRDLAAPASIARSGHAVVALADADALVVGGTVAGELAADALRFDRATQSFTELPGFLVTPRRDAAVAVAGNRLIVAGGIDAEGQVVADAELFLADSLAPLVTLPLVVPRTGAVATTLGNGQILFAGGTDIDGQPVGTLELFTPAL
jgi:hypothetical protein